MCSKGMSVVTILQRCHTAGQLSGAQFPFLYKGVED